MVLQITQYMCRQCACQLMCSVSVSQSVSVSKTELTIAAVDSDSDPDSDSDVVTHEKLGRTNNIQKLLKFTPVLVRGQVCCVRI